MDDAPERAVAISLKDGADLVRARQVAADRIDLGALDVLLARVRRQHLARELGYAREGLGERVAVVVERDHAIPPRLEQSVDYVRACEDVRDVLDTAARAPM